MRFIVLLNHGNTSNMPINTKTDFFKLYLWLVSVLFFMYTKMLNISMTSFSVPLISEFDFTQNNIALALSSFSLAIFIMKFFVGFIIDRFSYYIPFTVAIIITSIGVLFMLITTPYCIYVGRFLEGLGSSLALIGVYKVTSVILDEKYFVLVTGVIYFLGTLAIAFAGAPLTFLLNTFGYKIVVFAVFLFGVCLLVFLMTIIKNHSVFEKNNIKFSCSKSYFTELVNIFKNKSLLLAILYGAITTTVFMLVISFWGADFLHKIKDVSNPDANFMITSIISIFAGFFSIICGLLIFYRIFSKKVFVILSILSSCSLFTLFYSSVRSEFILILCAIIFGINYGFSGIVYDSINKISQKLLATSLVIMALLDLLLLSVISPFISLLQKNLVEMDFTLDNSYKIAVLIILLLSILSTIISFYINPQKTYKL